MVVEAQTLDDLAHADLEGKRSAALDAAVEPVEIRAISQFLYYF
jgi:hypothetical protein